MTTPHHHHCANCDRPTGHSNKPADERPGQTPHRKLCPECTLKADNGYRHLMRDLPQFPCWLDTCTGARRLASAHP